MTINPILFPERSVWETLLTKSSFYTFFQTYDWMSLWILHFGRSAEVWEVKDENKTIGIIPLLKESDHYSLIPTSTVLNGQQVSDYGELIIEKGREKEVIKQVIGERLKVKDKKIILNFIREDSAILPVFKDLGVHAEEQDMAPYVVLPHTFDEYLSILSRHSRHELRRKTRRFEESGAEFAEFVGSDRQIESFFQLMEFDEKKKSFLTSEMKLFFKEIIHTFYNKKEANILFIEAEGKLIAGIILFYFRDEVLLYNSGFDPDYFHLSPGLMVVTQAIKDSIEKKKKVFDFLRGNERYKYDLGGVDRKLYRIRF
ncbi:hypothetical protein A3D77_00645 [Candidatus Gottesmanbacteria bacterium RIFCSPHIGHO2_02_FULL_39_11]|uniref:BioF2-like acetyltransferase domain-containing protein n=1 Tax=Candidatus Gottesmanbacteria bacterium RIFCSPHIGHO2_02_FULL_39_11 TaxID=1798382 RepID=A0A1F5ZLL1_9BACT|nr:MAG: hypothetical protein A3D77_00645 [Candidatus Gottesmanbacteria bacterium RIFCSPHIGHO2_02_FULL_39_11]